MGERFDLPLGRCAEAPRAARHAIIELLTSVGRPELIDDATLLVSELVTNAVLHTVGPVVVRVVHGDRTLRVEVQDSDPQMPVLRQPSDLDTKGRGLRVLAAVAVRWAVAPVPGGKTVWFEVDYS